MTVWLKRARQTRTTIHDENAARHQRLAGERSAYQALGAILVTAQLLLWITLYAYDRTRQTVWQATAAQALPMAALFILWRTARTGLNTRAGRAARLMLAVCFLLDTALILDAFADFGFKLTPVNTRAIYVPFLAVMGLLTACLGHENGVAYGAWRMKFWLLTLFVLGTLLLGADVNPSRLWPLLGRGLGDTGLTALTGAGSVWGVALIFVFPIRLTGKQRTARPFASSLNGLRGALKGGDAAQNPPAPKLEPQKPAPVLYALLPLILAIVWALWFGMTLPWGIGDVPSVGGRLGALARRSASMLLSELGNVMWLLLLALALSGSISLGAKLIRSVFLRLPFWLCGLMLVLPVSLLSLLLTDTLRAALQIALPYRAALSLAAGIIALSGRGKGARTS